MAFLQQWCYCICITIILSVIFSLLTPHGSMQRFYKMAITLFIFASFLYPLKDYQGFTFDFSSVYAASETEETSNHACEHMLEQQIKNFLAEQGIADASVTCKVSGDYASGEIALEAVQIAVGDTYKTEDVADLVWQSLGIRARVIHIGE